MPTSVSGFKNRFFSNGGNQISGWEFVINQSTLDLEFMTHQDGARQLTAGASITVGEYAHAAATRRGEEVRIYRNGIDVTSSSATHVDPASSIYTMRLGVYSHNINDTSSHFNGFMTDALVYSRALTPPLIEWLADRTNHLYVEDTRRVFYAPTAAPTGWKPWLAQPAAHIYGGGII
jgi:hypothetical protein